MCDKNIEEALKNSHAGDLETQGKGIAECMGALNKVLVRLGEIPTRHEVREMIGEAMKIHVNTCDGARNDGKAVLPSEPNNFKLGIGKFFGLEAQGSRGVLFAFGLGVGAAVLLYKVAPYLGAWFGAFFSKGG